jgi:membrane-bound metal-dependent hydrolase YbcI (DUF457 family)
MTGPTHTLVGGSTGFVLATAAGASIYGVAFVSIIAALSSTAPDSLEKKLKVVAHRRLTHYPAVQLAFIALITYAAAMVMRPEPDPALVLGAGLAVGCLMHSIADAMTVDKHGIALLWPVSRRGYHLMPWSLRVWVGRKSISERIFCAVWLGFVLIYAYARFGHLIFS